MQIIEVKWFWIGDKILKKYTMIDAAMICVTILLSLALYGIAFALTDSTCMFLWQNHKNDGLPPSGEREAESVKPLAALTSSPWHTWKQKVTYPCA